VYGTRSSSAYRGRFGKSSENFGKEKKNTAELLGKGSPKPDQVRADASGKGMGLNLWSGGAVKESAWAILEVDQERKLGTAGGLVMERKVKMDTL